MRQLNEKEKSLIIEYLTNQKPCLKPEEKHYRCNLEKYRDENNKWLLWGKPYDDNTCWDCTYNADGICILDHMINELSEE